jgi:hypothetical protein
VAIEFEHMSAFSEWLLREDREECYPAGHKTGQKHGRDALAKMFSCMSGDPGSFPAPAVREMLFQTDTGSMDPDAMDFGRGPVTMAQFVKSETRAISKIRTELIQLKRDMLGRKTADAIRKMAGNKDVEGHKETVRRSGPLALMNKTEPAKLVHQGGKYDVIDGLQRMAALLGMMEDGELPDAVPVNAVVAYMR